MKAIEQYFIVEARAKSVQFTGMHVRYNISKRRLGAISRVSVSFFVNKYAKFSCT